MKLFCSSACLKRCLLVLLIVTLVFLLLSLTRKVLSVSKPSTIFELKTKSPSTVRGNSHDSKGVQSAVGEITNLLHSLTAPDTGDSKDNSQFGVNNSDFHATLKQHASRDGLIYLSSVDSGYLDLALNLYFSSFKKLGMDNYLFVGSDSELCESMAKYAINCFDYIHDKDAKTASGYFSKAFKRKTHLKTKIILEALKLGLKVVITDVDIVFLKDPTPFLNCGDCDIEISSDVIEGNSGFYIARPTQGAIQLHTDAWNQGLAKPEVSNQKAVDRTMEKLKRARKIKVRNLDVKTFVNGKVFFEDNKRMFAGDNPCKNCVIVHNNWIVSAPAKAYRFKEYGLWESDHNEYYSNPDKKYLVFQLPVDFGAKETPKHELVALNSAFVIAGLLDRVVILPKLHCYGCKYNKMCSMKNAKCTLGTLYRVDHLDSVFKERYRENQFLDHHLVPDAVKRSISPEYIISSSTYEPDLPKDVKSLVPLNQSRGPTVGELRQWFVNETSVSVLKFHSMYTPLDIVQNEELVKKVKSAFKPSDSRQYT